MRVLRLPDPVEVFQGKYGSLHRIHRSSVSTGPASIRMGQSGNKVGEVTEHFDATTRSDASSDAF